MGERNADRVFGLWSGELCWRAFSMATKQKLRLRCHGTDTRIRLMRRWRLILLRVTVLQMTLLTPSRVWLDSTHCWPAVPIVSRFTRYPNGLWQTKAPCVTEDYTPFSVGMLFFREMILLLVEEKQILSPFLDTLDKWHFPLFEVTVQEIYLFLAIIVQMRHIIGILQR